MGSRVRLDPERVFEVFLELAKPVQTEEEPYVLQIFPETYDDKEVLKSVPKFAFPWLSNEAVQTGEHFAFVLTDIEGRFKFGFCRMSMQTQTCLCMISFLPWYEVFYPLLDYISQQLSSRPSILPFLTALYSTQSFKSGETVEIMVLNTNEKYNFECPIPNQLPTLPENKNLLELCNCLDVNNLMLVFASLLYERRVLAVSQSLYRLTACIAGAALILHPMNWQHLYIPVLPPHLIDYCSAPMPYLIGLHSSVFEKAKVHDLGDAVIIRLDTNTVVSQYDDLSVLPDDVVSSLKRHLKQQDKSHGAQQTTGDGVARSFLKAMVALIGGYRDALRFRPGDPITFDPDAFIISRPADMQPFLRKILQLQTFQQFIADRLDALNAGEGFRDDFDVEASLYSDKWGSQSRYKDWLNHMKKQGKKLRREGKDRWVEFTAKVKDRSKKTFKDITSRIEDIKKPEDGAPISVDRENRALGVYAQPHRPPRPPPPNLGRALGPVPAPRQSTIRRKSLEKVQRYHPIMADNGVVKDIAQQKMERLSVDDAEVMFNPLRRVSTDLMADPDIQKAFRKSYSLEDMNDGSGLDDSDADAPSVADAALTWDHLSGQVTMAPVRWVHVDSEQSLNSKSSGSIAGTGSLTSSSEIGRVQPVPSKRQSVENVHLPSEYESTKQVAWSVADQPLIALDTNSSNSFNSLENIEFDPLRRPSYERQLRPTDAGQNPGKLLPPVPKPRLTKSAKPFSASPNLSPVAADIGWSASSGNVTRRGASPHVADAQSLREARVAFIQSDTVKPIISQRQESLDQFDPLASGQLVMDIPSELLSGRSVMEDDEDLLKEWNLGSDKFRPVTGYAPPLNNASGSHPPFASMPNLYPQQPRSYLSSAPVGSAYFVGYQPRGHPHLINPVAGGGSMGFQVPGQMNRPAAIPANRPAMQRLNPRLSNPLAPAVLTGPDFAARSATLPNNASAPSRISNESSTSFPRYNASSGQLSADVLLEHRANDPFDPLLTTNHRRADFVSETSGQWEKFE